MAQVNVKIAGRVYRMACADGEEQHLAGLAARLDGKISELRGAFGEIGDTRITVMAALTIADDLGEAERRIAALEAENDRLRGAEAAYDARAAALAEAVAGALGEAAGRIERVAKTLDARTTQAQFTDPQGAGAVSADAHGLGTKARDGGATEAGGPAAGVGDANAR